ncbi:MAG: LLM class flavin-dependent oxidoreductase [Ilumatobacter sp.]|nr:MAG: LLM class flavin-dependent oxidoreductase [Ilumatobacter sp.]
MRFSTSLPIIRDPSSSDPFHLTFELAQRAESAGFDTVTVGHHHFMAGNLADPLTFLAAVGARTSRIRLGTGIFQLPIHHPVRVAEQVAMLDELSGGRISLGVGLGWWPLEYEAHGSVFRERGARMEESLGILRRLWNETDVAVDGEFWSFPAITVHPRPVQEPHPPLWVAGVAEAAIDRAARLGDAWLCGPVQSLAVAERCLASYRASCARAGRHPEWILRRFAWIGPDGDEIAERVLPAYVDGLLQHWRESAEDDEERELFERIDAGEKIAATEIAGDRLLWGSPEQVIGQIERYRARTGCNHVHAAFAAGLPARELTPDPAGEASQVAAMIELFGSDVIPAFPPAL